LERFCTAVIENRRANGAEEDPEYQYYPVKWQEPYQSRRRELGWGLYGALGIQRGEKEKMAAQHERNFRFFDAPVGMIFTIDNDMELGSWLDYGTFLQTIMLAARAEGLHTCAQGAWVYHQGIVRNSLNLPSKEKIVCGMALGYLDEKDPSSHLETSRVTVDEFCIFMDS
jgi:nitroreductase